MVDLCKKCVSTLSDKGVDLACCGNAVLPLPYPCELCGSAEDVGDGYEIGDDVDELRALVNADA